MSYSERMSINDTNMVEQLRDAAITVYDTDKYDRRGEFGELILHALMREIVKTEPAISKIYFKDSVNNTVKGFDAVHILDTDNGIELWLGEVKFYKNASQAVDDVVKELELHFQDDYLKKEFMLISRKLDQSWSGTQGLKKLLNPNLTLDKVVKAIVVPVLLTYESKACQSFKKTCDEYVKQLMQEFMQVHERFTHKNVKVKVRIELFLFPMFSKQSLLDELHKRLIAAQNI